MRTDEYLRERDRIMGILKARRKELQLDQVKLAHLAGMHSNSISNWERAEYNPTLHSLIRLAEALHLRITFAPTARVTFEEWR